MNLLTKTSTIDAVIEELQERIDRAGLHAIIELNVSASEHMLSLDLIRSFQHGLGYAKKALSILLNVADESERLVVLTIHALEEETDEERLALWYFKHGFRPLPESRSKVMRREPHQKIGDDATQETST